MIELYSNEPNPLRHEFMVKDEPQSVDNVKITLATGNNNASWDLPVTLFTGSEVMGYQEYIVPNSYLIGKRLAKISIEYVLEEFGLITDEILAPIVKRYVTFSDVKSFLPNLSWSDFVEIERNARFTIDAFCSQRFNSWRGTRIVRSHNGRIDLPQHLDVLESLNMGYGSFSYLNSTDPFGGFVLQEPGFSLINQDLIRSPSIFVNQYKSYNYNVTGVWGYTSVPLAVRSAAIELIKGAQCADEIYRKKYVDNIRNENVRIQFRDELYTTDTTGNAVVDDLLGPYKIFYVGVV